MKIVDTSFRDLYQRFFAIDDFFSIRKLKKIIDFDLNGVILGYVFVNEGILSFYFLGNVIKEGYELMFDKAILDQKIYIPVADIESIKVTLLGDEISKIKYYDEVIKNTSEDNKYNIMKTREMKELDSFRDDWYPDSVLAALPKTNEKLWINILGVQSGNLLISSLDDDSKTNSEFTKGDLVGALYENNDEEKIVIKGHLRKK